MVNCVTWLRLEEKSAFGLLQDGSILIKSKQGSMRLRFGVRPHCSGSSSHWITKILKLEVSDIQAIYKFVISQSVKVDLCMHLFREYCMFLQPASAS